MPPALTVMVPALLGPSGTESSKDQQIGETCANNNRDCSGMQVDLEVSADESQNLIPSVSKAEIS